VEVEAVTFLAADHVHHRPTGEDWTLACDEHDGLVVPAGYPPCAAEASDCELVRAATDGERLAMLRGAAMVPGTRGALARRQLEAVA
jgi:hypothetical protein